MTERAWWSREKRSPSKITDAIVSVAFLGMVSDDAAMASFENRAQFERWLADKPVSWAQILACRAALRVLPLATVNDRLALLTVRAVGMSFAALNTLEKDIDRANYAAAAAAARRAGRSTAASAAAAAARATAYGYKYAAAAAADATSDAASAAAYTDGPAAADQLWSSIAADANWLEAAPSPHYAAEAMTAVPLWPDTTPNWFVRAWLAMRAHQDGRDSGFDVWLRWFDRRLEGHATAFALPADADRALQIKIAEQDEEFWDRDPAKINTDIQAWIDAAAPVEIPPQHPNDLQTIARDGRVARLVAPPSPVGANQEARRRAAWDAIRAAVDDWLADGPTNSPRLDRSIMRIAAAIGDSFDAVNPVGLGIHAETLQAMAVRADDILMAERAAGLVGLNMAIARFLPQFVEWTDFLGDANVRPDVTTELLETTVAIADAIAERDIAEPPVVTALAEQAGDARDEAAAHVLGVPPIAANRQRFLVGLGNTLATLGQIALDYAKPALREGGNFTKKVAKAGWENVGKGVGKGVETTAKTAVLGFFAWASAKLGLLAAAMPTLLGWVTALLTFLKNHGL